jgi:GTPase SAR1 family protein
MANDDWVLGLDFGTCFTVVSARVSNDNPEVVEIDGERRTPSVIFRTEEGQLLFGKVAEEQIVTAPDRAFTSPKSHIGDGAPVVIGATPYKVEQLVGSLLGYVTEQAVAKYGGPPVAVRLTRPATWGRTRCDALTRAAAQGGLTEVELIEEPVAAALSLAGRLPAAQGSYVAVYDFGGGTFDTTVLQTTQTGFQVVGTPGGDEALGGELIDELLLDAILDRAPDVADMLRVPPDLDWARSRAMLRADTRRAKESLSLQAQTDVRIVTPTGLHSVRMTRSDLEALMRPHVLNSVEILARSIESAGVTDSQLAAICLAGGMSRAPLVYEIVGQAFPTVTITRHGDPKTAVASGATLAAGGEGAGGRAKSTARTQTPPTVVASPTSPVPEPPAAVAAPPTMVGAAPAPPAEPVLQVDAPTLPMVVEATRWCGEVAAVLEAAGRDKGAAELRDLLGRPAKQEVIIVVAGEDKRGKSSLVNSLIGHEGLSPVGVETVTATPISLHYAPEMEAAVYYHGDPDPHPQEVVDALRVATLQGNPRNEQNVREVSIGLPAPILEGLVLVDTPGVGGLDSGHAALTLQSLRSADALLFVLEPGAQIRGPELKFLREAAARTSRIVFAVTKVDQYHGWRQIMDDNRAILAEHAPRFADAPMLPVSNLLANRGSRLVGKDDQMASELKEESGVADVAAVLRSVVSSDVEVLRAANLVQTGLIQIAPLGRSLAENVQALGSPEEAKAALLAEQAKLTELTQEKAEWPQILSVALRRLSLDRTERIQGGLADLRRRYEDRSRDIKRKEDEQLPGEFIADLSAFAGETNQWTVERLTDMVTELVGDVAQEVSVAETVEQISGDLLTEKIAAIPISSKLKSTDRITILSSYTSGHSMIAMLAAGGLGTVALGPIAIAAAIGLGSVFAVARFHVMKQQSFANQFRPWIGDQISRAQLNMTNNFQRTQIDVETEVRSLLKKAFIERERQIADGIAICKQAETEERTTRQQEREELSKQLSKIVELREAGKELLQAAARH